jgi:hypothetical protein
MSKHYKADNFGSSYCEATGEFDVYALGTATGMETDYCTACQQVEPEWTHLTQEEFDRAAL